MVCVTLALKVVCNKIKRNNLSLNETNALWQQIKLSELEFSSNSSKTLKPIFLSWFENKELPGSSFSYILNSIPLLSSISIVLVF
jgi:hypothetical protein